MNELIPIDYGWKILENSNFLTATWFEWQQVRGLFKFVCAFFNIFLVPYFDKFFKQILGCVEVLYFVLV